MDALDEKLAGAVIRETVNAALLEAVETAGGEVVAIDGVWMEAKYDRETYDRFASELRAAGFHIVRLP